MRVASWLMSNDKSVDAGWGGGVSVEGGGGSGVWVVVGVVGEAGGVTVTVSVTLGAAVTVG